MTDEQKAASDKLKELIGYSSLSSANKTTADNLMAGLQSGNKTIDDVIDQLTTLANNKTEKDVKQKATDFYTAVAKKAETAKLDEDVRTELEITDGRALTDKDYQDYLNKKGYKINDKSSYKTEEEYQEAIKSAKDKYIEKKTKQLLKTDEYKNKISNAVENGLDEDTVKAEKLDEFDPDNEDYKTDKFTFENRMKRTLQTNADIEKSIKDYAEKNA